MMKTLIVLNGPMGVGKTTVGKELCRRLAPSIFLDGDWCWDLHPFVVSEENKQMVMQNIQFLLCSFLKNESLRYLVFAWVIPEEAIASEILSALSDECFRLCRFTLLASPESLSQRLQGEIDQGLREPSVLKRSLSYLLKYRVMDTIAIDTSHLTPAEVVQRIASLVREKEQNG